MSQNRDRHEKLAALAAAYVPQWRFSPEQPDPGTVVALLVDDMLAQSEDRLKRAIHKYKVQYLNLFHYLKMEPLESAKSYVRFTQVAGMDRPVHIPKGTQLTAEVPADGKRLVFETSYAITTTHATIEEVFATDGKEDCIVRLADGEKKSFRAFDILGVNEAEHRLLLFYRNAFDAINDVPLGLKFSTFDPESAGETLKILLGDNLTYSLLEPEGEHDLGRPEDSNGAIRLSTQGYTPQKVDFDGETGYVLSIRAKNSCDLRLNSLGLSLSGSEIPPDEIKCAGVTRQMGRFMPFGSPMELYSECSIECDHVFARRGAWVNMDFQLTYEVVERLLPEPIDDPELKVIMRRPQQRAKVEAAQVRADYVLLEYRSPVGWKRLLLDEHTARLFNGSAEGDVRISFQMPGDIVDPDDDSRMRLRLIQAENLYMMPSVQLCPVITQLRFSYEYRERGQLPERAVTRNNFVKRDVTRELENNKEFIPFSSSGELGRYLYLGFNSPPEGTPLSLYWELENDEDAALSYTAEYLSPRGFEQLQTVDNTAGMLYTGTMLFPVPSDCASAALFGRELYWIRLLLQSPPSKSLPHIHDIETNMVRVENLISRSELFYVEEPDAPLSCELGENSLVAAEVYVNEDDGDAEKTDNWQRWNARSGVEQRGRFCDLDLAAGRVEFPRHAFAPYPLKPGRPAVRVDYQSYQGSEANVPAGAINTMTEALRFVASASNPVPAYGGYDSLNEETASRAISNILRTRNRAVTEQDYMHIISQVSSSVRRIRCYPGIDRVGKPAPNCITIALLIDRFEKGGHIFSDLRGEIRDKLLKTSGLVPLGKELSLTQPYFMRFSARVWISCPPGEDPYTLQQQTLDDIAAFIDPLEGGFEGEGWEIGTLPATRHLLAWMKTHRPGLTVLRAAMSASFRDVEYDARGDLAEQLQNPFVLAVNGEHTVYVELPDDLTGGATYAD